MPAELSFSCLYCGPGFQIGPHITHEPTTASETQWRQWWKDHGPSQNSLMECAACGAQHGFQDDGNPASSGGAIEAVNTSQPKVASLDVATGPAAGGTTVIITGDFLEVGTLVVKFGGVAGVNMQAPTKTTVQVDTPAGSAGAVDVTVENEYGQRVDGSSAIVGGFTYT